MKKRLARLVLVGSDAQAFGSAALTAEFRKSKGVPVDAKELRRYRDVSFGQESVVIVLEHPSFAEVEDGGLIPEIPKPAQEPAKQDNKPGAAPVAPVAPVVTEPQEPAKQDKKAGKNK